MRLNYVKRRREQSHVKIAGVVCKHSPGVHKPYEACKVMHHLLLEAMVLKDVSIVQVLFFLFHDNMRMVVLISINPANWGTAVCHKTCHF